ncbi:hypothetical protein KY285_021072 [Solanum tuberosum]|nr:hypothetical protein KY285_021072 [Solanum tuberosum]
MPGADTTSSKARRPLEDTQDYSMSYHEREVQDTRPRNPGNHSPMCQSLVHPGPRRPAQLERPSLLDLDQCAFELRYLAKEHDIYFLSSVRFPNLKNVKIVRSSNMRCPKSSTSCAITLKDKVFGDKIAARLVSLDQQATLFV